MLNADMYAEQAKERFGAVTGLASIARGCPRASWGEPQTPVLPGETEKTNE